MRRASPATADIQHAHSAPAADFARDQVELCFLRLSQCRRVLPVGAAVNHSRIEHPLVEIVTEVVVTLANDVRASRALHVVESRAERQKKRARGTQVFFDIDTKNTRQHLVELVAVPPAVHIGLAGAK